MYIDFDRDDLLTQAHDRVANRRDVERVRKGTDAAYEQLSECLALALRCVQTLAKPAAAVIEVNAAEILHDLTHGDEPLLLTPRVEPSTAGDVKACLYLVTCGLDSREAMRWLESDYAAYHFQNEIARELVFAVARHTHRSVCADHPGHRFVRHAIRTEMPTPHGAVRGNGGASRLWDPRGVGRLLQRFGSDALAVSTTSAGCLTPLHSLLGLMIGTPLCGDEDAAYPAHVGAEPACA
ncbi:MAG TPA: hypothetical protein VJ698_22265 [Noviherbaspirillum sp.]|uniref:hypothetical protein n=1 Tax=Noviherbaspirillum sp. TaxID=1926288 RepID=UPI002B48D8EB|nr:hypothetical protein [Noviherbaspirillum sp.]HJV88211.1 hypothetical protein [Noviherbaspirillum sp.]